MVRDTQLESPPTPSHNRNTVTTVTLPQQELITMNRNNSNNSNNHNSTLNVQDVKDTLVAMFEKQNIIEVESFLGLYPTQFHMSIAALLKNMTENGEIMESRAGSITQLH